MADPIRAITNRLRDAAESGSSIDLVGTEKKIDKTPAELKKWADHVSRKSGSFTALAIAHVVRQVAADGSIDDKDKGAVEQCLAAQ